MKKDFQTIIDSFDRNGPPRCHNNNSLNGFKKNCFLCPHATRKNRRISCILFRKSIRTLEKYALKDWKKLREAILARDDHQCCMCGVPVGLHIHHIDLDNTNDSASNLISLCNSCHKRTHQELSRKDGRDQMCRAINIRMAAKKIDPVLATTGSNSAARADCPVMEIFSEIQ